DGVCLVYGKGQQALEVARRLCGRLSVSLLLEEADDVVPPSIGDVPIYKGKIAAATGHFGAFEIVVDGYAPIRPASRGEAEFLVARDGASSQCDLILDMTGGAPLFPSHKRRDGYFHVDPARPGAVAEAMFEIADLVGEFEKPIYVTYDPAICSHSRSRKTGCTRCLDVCPASAISSQGDRVSIDTAICGGCGACHAVCPSGAVSYAYPRREDLLGRLRVLLAAYRRAGGTAPVLLIHDSRHGAETIAMMARFGRGLPANVLPFAVNEVSVVGHDLLVAGLTFGAQKVVVLADPAKADELSGLTAQCALVSTIVEALGYEGERVSVLAEADPDAVEALLWESPGLPQLEGHDFNPAGTKRAIVRTALASLNDAAPARQEIVSLPEGAPYGRISIDTGGCTLCLACVSACPMGALLDNPERPQVRFVESACVQCGLCRTTCPEGVIS